MNTKRISLLSLIAAFICFWSSCSPPKPEVNIPDLSSYQLAEDLHLEVVSAEPLIKSPVAIDFDLQGRIWVLELPGYMANIEGTGENDPVGRIMILEDQDNDGFYETANPFLEGLRTARAFKLAYGGLLFAEPPNLWFVEIDGNQAGERTLVDSAYVEGGNIEHQPNGLDINIDNWIYNAKSSYRYQMVNGEWYKDVTTFRGQWGIAHDDHGRLFYNDNSNPLYGDFHLPNQLNQNLYHPNKKGENEVILKDRRVFPLQATSVNRGYIEGVLDENGILRGFTSACGPVIYRGDGLGENFKGDAFVCGPEVNLIKRISLEETPEGIAGSMTYEGKEFLISKDEAFRPVNLYNGPDGALYIVDYHHGIIQHKVYMTAYLREQYLAKGLDTIVNYGRILKVQQSAESAPVSFPENNNYNAWVNLLRHPNGWVRDQAQHLLITEHALGVEQDLIALATDASAGIAALHAAWTMEGLQLLSVDFLKALLATEDPELAATAVLFSEQLEAEDSQLIFEEALSLKVPKVDWQIAVSAGKVNPLGFEYIDQVLKRYADHPTYLEAALSGLAGHEAAFIQYLTTRKNNTSPILSTLQNITEDRKKKASVNIASAFTDSKTKGLKLFRQHCVSCHGENGQGIKNLAPPLQDSEYVKGDAEKLVLLTLHGLQGPITVNGQRYELNAVMPGLKDNASLSDENIANLLSYVRNAFADEYLDVTTEEVKAGRSKSPKGKMYTEAELK